MARSGKKNAATCSTRCATQRAPGTTAVFTVLGERAASETALFAYQLSSFKDQPMHKHKRKADYVMHCDASDHALAAIIIKAPHEDDAQRPFYRRLHPHEVGWSSVLRELTGYRDAYLTLRRRRNMSGMVIEIVGDSLCCQYIFGNGGSQVADEETGVLQITETLLDLLTAAAADGAEVRFRWVRRECVQDADDLSKFADRMDFGLRPEWLDYVLGEYGPWDVDRFAGDHNTTAKRFNALFDSKHAEAADAMAQDWSEGVSFILPDFHMVDRIMDKIERDNANVTLIVPEWPNKSWWRRLRSGAWRARVAKFEILPANILVPNNEHCFFGTTFTSRLVVLRINELRVEASTDGG